MPAVVIIAGSRDLQFDVDRVVRESGFVVDVLINGGCPTGIDAAALAWARARGIPVEFFHAGPIRNREMARRATHLIAIHNGSPGTMNMIDEARKRGLKIFEVRVE